MEDVLKAIVGTIYDCIEECLKSFTVPSEKKIVEVFFGVLIIAGISVLGRVLGLWLFISIPEAVTAVVVAGVLLLLYYVNMRGVETLKKQLKREVRRKHEKQ